MSLSSVFIRRPVATILVMVAILVFGAMGYRLLPVNDLPTVDFPTIVVSANLAGANPETMASSVATPLEREFSTIAGIDSMTSSNSQGSTQITLQFALERDIDAAAQDVQSAISKTTRRLPSTMTAPPSFRKVNPADQAVFMIALASDTLPLSTVNEYADTFLAQRISMVEGVAQVQIFGSQKYAVRIQLDPRKLVANGLGIDEVARAIQQGNVNLPVGTLYGPHMAFTLASNGQLMNAREYESLVVDWRGGSPIFLRDIGRFLTDPEAMLLAWC